MNNQSIKTGPALSVIIPVYNVVHYLEDCINSFLVQRFADFELLLVDDGSNDGSGRICDEFAEKDQRVIALHQENRGASFARNRGIDNAQGEFIVFADADDFVTEFYLEHLMESDADMVVTGLCKFGEKRGISMPASRADFGIKEFPAHWNTPPNMNYLYCYPVAKRFRTRILKEQRIRFDEMLFFSEDMCFNMNYYYYSESFTELPYADYMYRIMGITRDEKYRMSASDLVIHYEHIEACFQRLYKRIAEGSLDFVRDNTNLRVLRKFYSFLIQDTITPSSFVQNVRMFRNRSWADYMMGLLVRKKEKRIMQEAIRFPHLTYWTEIRLKNAICNVSQC